MCNVEEILLSKSAEEFAVGTTAFQNLGDHIAKIRTKLPQGIESKPRDLEKAGTLPPPLVAPNPPKP